MSWPALVEVWPHDVLLFVPSLPGFQVNAESPESAVADARDRIDAYLQWLTEGELADDLPTDADLVVVEELAATGAAGPIFEMDSSSPEPDEIELALAVGRAALSDLLFVFDDVPPVQRASAERTLRHVAEMDRWYATRIAPAQGRPFVEIEDELVQSASLFEEIVDATFPINQPVTWILDAEPWSIRKVLRRRTGHLREHLPDLIALAG